MDDFNDVEDTDLDEPLDGIKKHKQDDDDTLLDDDLDELNDDDLGLGIADEGEDDETF